MNANVPMIPPGMQVPASMQGFLQPGADDLTGGVGGMPILSVRGRVFRFKYRGIEQPIVDQHGYAMPFLDVLIVRASPTLSKIFYKDAYNEGDDNAPDCWSADGVYPDPSAPLKQCATCAACPQNLWGSKITPQGNKTKACADNRRLAIVPAGDPMNVNWGGITLLRVPPASLADLATYGNGLQSSGIPYQAVITRLSWDMGVAFPKLTYQFGGMVNDEQAKAVHHWYDNEQTRRLLSSAPTAQPVAAPAGPPPYQQPVTPSVYAGPPQPQVFQPQPAPVYAPQPPQPAPVYAPQPQPQYTTPQQPVANPQYAPPSAVPPSYPPPGAAAPAYAPLPGQAVQGTAQFVPPPAPAMTPAAAPPQIATAPVLAPGQPAPVAPATTRRGRPRATQPAAPPPPPPPPPPATAMQAAPTGVPIQQPAASVAQPNGSAPPPQPAAAPQELENLLGTILQSS